MSYWGLELAKDNLLTKQGNDGTSGISWVIPGFWVTDTRVNKVSQVHKV